MGGDWLLKTERAAKEGKRSNYSTASCYFRNSIRPLEALDTREAHTRRHETVSSLPHRLFHSTVFTSSLERTSSDPSSLALNLAEALLIAGMVL